MSSNTIDQTLTTAYDLIEAERLYEAQALLKPLLDTQKNNPDVWWLYAHAVTDIEVARNALETVLRLDAGYPGASELLRDLEAKAPRPAGIKRVAARPAPATLPDLPSERTSGEEDEPDFDFEIEDTAKRTNAPARSRLGMLLAAIVGAVVIGLLLLVILSALNRPRDTQTVDATPTTQIIVVEATIESSPVPLQTLDTTDVPLITETVDASSVADIDFIPFYAALDLFEVPDDGVRVTQTPSFGDTLLVTVCADPTDLDGLRETTNDVMDILANQSAPIATSVNAVGVELRNCQSQSSLRIIAVGIQDALAYAEGSITQDAFSALWRPQ